MHDPCWNEKELVRSKKTHSSQQLRTQEAGERQVLKSLEQAKDAYTAGNISVRMAVANVPKCKQ